MSFCHYNNFVAIVANGSNPLLIVLNKVLLFTKRGRHYIFLAYPLFLFDLRTSVSNISWFFQKEENAPEASRWLM